MRAEFSGTVPKDLTRPESNEDKFAFSEDSGRFALCDGASESFDSRCWADLLACRFVLDPKVNPDWVATVLREYSAAHDFESMTWSKQAAYERGSFATLLGIEYDEIEKAVEVLAVGDSVAVLVSGGKLIAGWPFEDPARFKERPTLLATVPGYNDFVGQAGFWTERSTTFHLGGLAGPLLLCMTDALGEWALKQALIGGDGFDELLGIENEEELAVLVQRERLAKRMRVDDSTLVVLSFAGELEGGLPVT